MNCGCVKSFYQGYRLGPGDLYIDFQTPSYVGPFPMTYKPFFISYEIGYIQAETIVYVRIGALDRIPAEGADDTYYANFIIDPEWSPGDYQIRWKYCITDGSPLEIVNLNFQVIKDI